MEEILDSLLRLNAENEVVEFKEAKVQYSKEKLGQYFSALSNEANIKGVESAWIVMGVNNCREVVGTIITDQLINEFKKEVGDHTSPRCTFTAITRLQKEGKDVLLLEIPAAPKGVPMSWKGHRYGRNGESLSGLSDYEFDLIRRQNKVSDWSAQIIEGATIDDLSKEAILFARAQYKEKNPKLNKEVDEWSDAKFLDKAKITIKGKITNAAILLLGKPESDTLIIPSTPTITWILKDEFNLEKDYAHFGCPVLLTVQDVRDKIRNLKYRYLKSGTLFPEEVDQYDPYIIREALNNCIAHQDYTLGGKIVVVESDSGYLSFTNAGSFIPGNVEDVVISESPEPIYRNGFLAQLMVNLNLIDTIGSGIKRMFNIQRQKFFPLPEYDFSNQKVNVKITGKIIDLKYAQKLAEIPDLSLEEIIYLDKVSKHKALTDNEIKVLKKRNLLEGRKPNFHISSSVASLTNEKEDYIKLRGFKDEHYKKMILEYLGKYKSATKADIDKLIYDFLPAVLTEEQRRNKIRNLLYAMSKKDISIKNTGTVRFPTWVKV